MRKQTLGYSLAKGYIHHWLVAGPQQILIEDLDRFGNPPDKQQIVHEYHQSEPGISGKPVEFGECRMGEDKARWRYVHAAQDHLVDLSAYHSGPRLLRAWAYTELESLLEQEVTFVLTTQGPTDVWINDRHIHHQEYLSDQVPVSARFQASLKNGTNRLLVRFEQMAIRECAYSLALQISGFQGDGKERVVGIPTEAPSLRYRQKLEALFEECSLRQDVYARKDPIVAYLPKGKATETPFTIRMQTPGGSIYAEAKWDGTQKEPEQPMGFPFQLREGTYQLRFMPPPVDFYEHNVRITRSRDFYASTNVFSPQPYATYAERCSECLQDAARRKTGLFSELARMEGGWWQDVDEKAVLAAIEEVNQRHDGAVIQLCGLLGMIYRYADHESFPASLRQPLENCVLGFKYWEDEPCSDIMDYHSESRSILFHTCECLAGQRYPERIFTNSGQPGRWHLETGTRLALEWLQARAGTGFEDWDSPAAFEEIVLALSTLSSLADDPQVFEMAALVLDKLFFTLAVKSFQGVFGSTHGRALAAHIKTAYREPTSGISRLLWGMGIFNEHLLGSVSLACSSYELPPILAAIAADLPAELWSQEQHSGVNTVTYKTPDGMLCSAQDWHPGQPGAQEHIWQATLSPMVTVFTSHPACASERHGYRPSYWAGNVRLPRVVQWKDALVAIYNFPDDDWMGFTHAYFPVHGMDEYKIQEGWAFGKVGNGYIALAAAGGLEFQTRGDHAYRELCSPGTPNVWLCQLGRLALDGTFGEFIEKVLALPVKFDGTRVELTTLRGDRIQFGWEGSLLRNGEPISLKDFKHYENPYCTCELGSSVMEIQYGGDVLRLHFESQSQNT